MNRLVFATGNPNKIREVKALLPDRIQLLGLKDIGCEIDLPETQDTIPGNALQKARYVNKHYRVNCFSEDSGLEVDALGGEPGVHSAHYAGPARDADANMALLLQKLGKQSNRSARFRTVIALIIDGEEHLFEGTVEGVIAFEKQGSNGFGYDPLFIPQGHERSFGQMTDAEKNAISHRAVAIAKLQEFLNRAS